MLAVVTALGDTLGAIASVIIVAGIADLPFQGREFASLLAASATPAP